jgi:DNA replication protein DnaC
MKAEATSYLRLLEHLPYPRLTTAAEILSGELDRELKETLSTTQVIESLLEAEEVATQTRRACGRLRFAHLPVHKKLVDFDFDCQPTLDRTLIAELSTLRFVEEPTT